MSTWYYAKNNLQYGPVSSEELKRLAASGQLLPTDLVCKPGMPEWIAAQSVTGLFHASTESLPPIAPVTPPSESAPMPEGTSATAGASAGKSLGQMASQAAATLEPLGRKTASWFMTTVWPMISRQKREHKLAMAAGTVVLVLLVLIRGCGSGGAGKLDDIVASGNTEQIRELVQSGIDVKAKGRFGITPLHVAAFQGQSDAVQTLLSLGADVNAETDSGVTPLWFAAYNGQQACAELLVQSGADINIARCGQISPWNVAFFRGHAALSAWFKTLNQMQSGVAFGGFFSGDMATIYKADYTIGQLAENNPIPGRPE